MGDKSGIEWTEATWNPVTGCSKVSPGCANCYAEGVALRFWAKQYPPITTIKPNRFGTLIQTDRPRAFTDVMCHDDRLDQPLRWKRPRRIFVNSMSDLFHEDVPDEFIDGVFAVMALAPQHTFQILTKRADRMRTYMTALMADAVESRNKDVPHRIACAMPAGREDTSDAHFREWPLDNVWLGVSVENQHFADKRIPLLLQTPAAVRFISAEPLLRSVDLCASLSTVIPGGCANCSPLRACRVHGRHELDWVIVGGESGKGARPFDVAWARSIVEQCKAAGVPVFVKQLGPHPHIVCPDCEGKGTGKTHRDPDFCNRCLGCHRQSVGGADRKGGDPSEWPEDLRVRQFPEVRA